MTKRIMLASILILLATYTFADSTSTARGKFGAGLLLPFPIALELSIGNVDIDFGLYAGSNNLFRDWKTLFLALDYIFYTFTFSGAANILDFAVGGGAYGTIWFSRWGSNQANHGPMSLGARLPLILNLAVVRKKFDVFLKVAPGLGLNIWSKGVGFRWEVFAGLGLRVWFA
ncbi:hypothetical protein CR532_02950 [Candidatus Borreliella tachyglossi]|uniref:DUF3996 domain-containing protein n=1 Tax=Candidatus Borreliella tachyglossi TaxID=1964448 RepID=A0A2S1LXC2_9SPIR|nr:DUF3996 domain-containing protein [Candidatus Borreliella tachyglossi]AWG42930.1 hypothetical protein CR532_02950 [Candidatus Borreliella tachyglossi]